MKSRPGLSTSDGYKIKKVRELRKDDENKDVIGILNLS